MAYGFTFTLNAVGSGDYVLEINESDCGPASEATVTGLPPKGRILAQISQIISGAGTTVDPILGTATNPGALNLTTILENDVAAIGVNNQAEQEINYYDTDGQLFHRSVPDTGLSVIKTLYYLKSGWGK